MIAPGPGNAPDVSEQPDTLYCTVQLGPLGPQAGVLIDHPGTPAWRADFVGESPTAWSFAWSSSATDGIGSAGAREPSWCVTVTILTGERETQRAAATVEGDGVGTAWLTGLEPFAASTPGEKRREQKREQDVAP
jgi:hypothetical protein